MAILTFPHCGRTFVCDDTINILDVRKAIDAFRFALQYGEEQVNAYSRAYNMRQADFSTVEQDWTVMFDDPLVGFAGGINFVKQPTPYQTRMPIELVDSYDMSEITIGFRMMTVTEAIGSSSNLANGQGVRGQRVAVTLSNLSNNLAINVLDIYYDRQWYNTNITTAFVGNPFIDLATMTASGGLSTAGLDINGHNVITILQAIPKTFRAANVACAGALNITYQFPRDYNGNPWTYTTQFQTNNIILKKPHPLTGQLMAFTGVNEATMRFFRTDAWEQGTATQGSRFRSYPLTPLLTVFPLMGDTLTHNLHNYQNALATSIKGIGWPAIKAVGANRGGFIRPLAGFSYRGPDADQMMEFYAEVPEGATQFMILAYLRTSNRSGSNQTVSVIVDINAPETLTATTNLTSGSTAARWWYVTGSLNFVNLATNNSTNRMKVTFFSEQTVNLNNRIESPIYWDGIHSILLKFF